MVRQLSKISPYNSFVFGLKAPETKRQWPTRLDVFLTFLELDGKTIEERTNQLFRHIKKEGVEWLQNQLLEFIEGQKERVTNGEISESTIPNYIKPVKTFCYMNNILVNWKLIGRGIPKASQAAKDRPPTIEEIHKLLRASDPRVKPIVLVMLSSGIRVGAWDYLLWKHVTPIYDDDHKIIVAAKLLIYPGDKEEYYTFITSEAYNALKDWINFRANHGEKINDESPLMRDLWQIIDLPKRHGRSVGFGRNPRKISCSAIKNIIYRALRSQSIIDKLDPKKEGKRHEFKTMHGFRKFFKTTCEQSEMRSINIEILMGHNIGVSSSYYKPRETEVLKDYLKAINFLTVNEEHRLREENIKLKKDIDFTDREIAMMKQGLRTMATQIGLDLDKLDADFIEKHPGYSPSTSN
ncbi:MAG: hypothetical protein ACPKPY_05440 [Nitrososphaeraceae archaeon]